MIIIVKKSNIIIISFVFLVSFITFNLYTRDTVPTLALPTTNKAVIVDAGHGSPDGGASSKSGVLEKDINLKISKHLQALLEQDGGIAVITRKDDSGIYDSSCNTIREKKNSDLKNREKIINNSEADAFVSIHLNNFSQPKYYGAQVFYSPNNEKSKILAEIIQKSLVENIDNNNNRKAKKAPDSVYLLKKVQIPAVVVECGFLSNLNEAELLQKDSYQKQVAWCIYLGLIEYFAEEQKTP